MPWKVVGSSDTDRVLTVPRSGQSSSRLNETMKSAGSSSNSQIARMLPGSHSTPMRLSKTF